MFNGHFFEITFFIEFIYKLKTFLKLNKLVA